MKRWKDKEKEKLEERTFIDKVYGLGRIRKPDSNHRLITRRDFLSHAVNASLAYALLPSVFSLASRKLYAQDCQGVGSNSNPLSILVVDMAGGLPLNWQFTPGGAGGALDFLTGTEPYANFGLTPDSDYSNQTVRDNIIRDFGIPLHPGSTFAEAMRNIIPAPDRVNIDGFNLVFKNQSDTSSNTQAFLKALGYFGFGGSLAATAGVEPGSGGRHMDMIGTPGAAPSPVTVASAGQARGLAGFSMLQQMFENPQSGTQKGTLAAERTLKAIQSMSETARKQFSNLTPDTQAEIVIRCGLLDSVTRPRFNQPDNIMGTDQNPFALDPILNEVFNLPGRTTAETQTGIMARLLFEQYIGVGNVVMGGCDNHANAGVTAPFDRLRETGRIVGAAMRYFQRRNAGLPENEKRSLLVVLTSDGGQRSEATRPYQSTANGLTFPFRAAPGDYDHVSHQMLLYSPKIDNTRYNLFRNNAQVRTSVGGAPRYQLGHWTPAGVADNSSVFYNSPTNFAAVVVMNILALFDRHEEHIALTGGRNLFVGNQLEKHLVLAPVLKS